MELNPTMPTPKGTVSIVRDQGTNPVPCGAHEVLDFCKRVADYERPHPFMGLRNLIELMPVTRGLIAVAEAMPILESASVYTCGFQGEENVLDTRRWEEDIVAVEAMDRRRECRNVAYRDELRRFAQRLRSNEDEKPRNLRRAMANLFGWELKPDYGPPTIAYLKRLQFGMADPDITRACRLAFAMHSERMSNALRGSLAATFRSPLRDIPHINLNLGPCWEICEAVGADVIFGGRPLNIGRDRMEHFHNSFTDYYRLNLRWCREVARVLD